jgi:hypothetical protein
VRRKSGSVNSAFIIAAGVGTKAETLKAEIKQLTGTLAPPREFLAARRLCVSVTKPVKSHGCALPTNLSSAGLNQPGPCRTGQTWQSATLANAEIQNPAA